MSHLQDHLQRSVQAFLCTQPKRDDDKPALMRTAVITGWKLHTMPRSNEAHMRMSAYSPVTYELVDALERELRALGLTPQDVHALNKDIVADGQYLIMADAPTYDGKHVQGLSITVSQASFDALIAPQLDRWRSEARSARTA